MRSRSVFVAALLVLACAHGPAEHAHQGAASPGEHPHHGAAPAGEHAYRHEGHAPHRFEDAERWAARFEDASRDAWQKPGVVLDALALAPDHVVADIGSATGYFPVRIAPRVPRGRVWGVDVEPDMVRYLNARARREGHANLFSVLGRPDDALLPEPVDRVLLVDTYHHIADRTAYFAGLAAHLAPGGRLVIVDFERGDLPVGPPDAMKIPPDQVRRELEAAGWELESSLHGTLPYQYVLVFRRP